MPEVFVSRGWAYYLQNNYEAALSDYNRVLRAVPDDMFALYNRALLSG